MPTIKSEEEPSFSEIPTPGTQRARWYLLKNSLRYPLINTWPSKRASKKGAVSRRCGFQPEGSKGQYRLNKKHFKN